MKKIVAALFVAAILPFATSCAKRGDTPESQSAHGGKTRIAYVADSAKGFGEGVRLGAEEASKEIGGVSLIVKVPETATSEAQAALIDALIVDKVDAIAITPIEDAHSEAVLLAAGKRAIDAGIKVVSIETDIGRGSRSVHLNASNLEVSARAQMDLLGSILSWKGEVAILAGKGRGQRGAIEIMRRELAENPQCRELRCLEAVQCEEEPTEALEAAKKLLREEPGLKGIVAPSPATLAAAARAIQEQGLAGKVALTGFGVPSGMKAWVESGVVHRFAVKNPIDLGYSAICILHSLSTQKNEGTVGESISVGRIGAINIGEDCIAIMGEPYVATRENSEQLAALF